MEEIIQDIHNIISECNNQINDKILGVNYLEKLKYLLIDKFKKFKITSMENIQYKETIKEYSQNNLSIKFQSNSDPLSKLKNIVENDYLCIVLNGSKSIKIHNNSDKTEFKSINLLTNTGIVLSKDTVISESLAKNTILIDIINIKNAKDIEN